MLLAYALFALFVISNKRVSFIYTTIIHSLVSMLYSLSNLKVMLSKCSAGNSHLLDMNVISVVKKLSIFNNNSFNLNSELCAISISSDDIVKDVVLYSFNIFSI